MFFIFLEWKCDKIILKTTLKNKHTTLRQGQTHLIINNIQENYFFSKKCCTNDNLLYFCSGDMAERSIAAVLKTVIQKCIGGSNPSVSARVAK